MIKTKHFCNKISTLKMKETNLIAKADIKVDSGEFCRANYDGMWWIIICSSTVLMLFIYVTVAFIICSMTIFSFLSNVDHLIQL